MVQMFIWWPTRTEKELFYCRHSRHKGEKKEPCLDVQGSILLEGSSALTNIIWVWMVQMSWCCPPKCCTLIWTSDSSGPDERWTWVLQGWSASLSLRGLWASTPKSLLEAFPWFHFPFTTTTLSDSYPPNPPFFFFPHYHPSPVSLPLLFIMPSISSRLMPSGVLPSFWNMD